MELLNRAPVFWRKIKLRAEQNHVFGEVEDNVHHFTVLLNHDGALITEVQATAIRVPWTTCPGATAALHALVGTPVLPNARADVDQALQCTHMLDLAKLAIAQIARGGERRYEILIRSGETPDICNAAITRDGRLLFDWEVCGRTVVAPAIFEGHCVTGRAVWQIGVAADPDLREAGLVLRRGLFIFRSRPRSFSIERASVLEKMRDVCFTFQSVRVNDAIRPPGFLELEGIPPGMTL